MYLQRLSDGGFSEWRAMWNRDILPYLRSLSPVAGPGVLIDRRPGGTLIRAVPSAAAAAAAVTGYGTYDSYFKLTLSSGAGGAAITIADGATGSDSIAVVNGGSTYVLPPYTAPVSGATVYFLQYTPAQYNSGGQLVSGASMAISSVEGAVLPSGGTSGAYYMQLGRVVGSSGGELRVVQDHTAGVAYFNWYVRC